MTYEERGLVGNSFLADACKVAHCADMSDISSHLAEPTLEELMITIRDQKSRPAFRQLFLEIAPKVKGYLIAGGATQDVAEDVLQEVMVKIWRFADKFDPAKASVNTWVFRIARNARIDLIRREKRPEYDPEDPGLQPQAEKDPDINLQQLQDACLVRKALESLPKDQAEIVRLSFYADMTHAQIAEKVHIPLGTVKSRIRLALEKMSQILDETK